MIGFYELTWSIVQTQTEGWLKGRLGKEEAAKAKAGTESRNRKIWFGARSTVLFGSASRLMHSGKFQTWVAHLQFPGKQRKTLSLPRLNFTNKIKQNPAQKRCLAQLGSFLCIYLTIHASTPWPLANSLHSRNSLSPFSLLVSYCYCHKYSPLYSCWCSTGLWHSHHAGGSGISRDHLVLFYPWLTSLFLWNKRKNWTKRSLPFTQKKLHLLNRPHFVPS